ncbi:ATP-NAD kinase family protein [Tritrichomonas foetus]|uniref:ATP-NAD kinase family protein n=1 Tax=Tritrichomonas foetus TaxID=1144522 RepID=A0A1J4K9A9_9EUKA|nr:ATP-NAD kinase family protein [Tritrichomonas foetus]|eukprot:OHT06021.1 ATP-NAD kinase family protein [Tritrichomonas foetus]
MMSMSRSASRDKNSPAPFRIEPLKNGAEDGSMHFEWAHQPRSALLIEKKGDKQARHYIVLAARYLFHNRHFSIFVENYVKEDLKNYAFLSSFENYEESMVDFVLSFGGDGTLLHIAKLFPRNCPPIVPFAMGSLGFLTPFLADDYKSIIDDLIRGFFYVISRTRILCSIQKTNSDGNIEVTEIQAMNDVAFKPSKNGTVSAVDCSIDDEYFTTVYGDGLIVATSTGSTAYNLSANGVIIHPSVSTLVWTPICAHALNAHPLVLPDSIELSLKIAKNARGNDPYTLAYDSSETLVSKNDKVTIRISPYPVPTVCQKEPMTDYLNSISSVLKWNQPIHGSISIEDEVSDPSTINHFFVCVDGDFENQIAG